MKEINAKKISFSYDEASVLKDVDLTADAGEFIVILGTNGCGKSTLVKHFNALYPLQCGELMVAGMDTGEKGNLPALRRKCGMVFQNPDNQFVSTVIEEDIAFGLRNFKVPEEEIPGRIQEALRLVGLEGYEKRSPQEMSGGQKQRTALAGVLAVHPSILIFDEATSMLDPAGRNEIMDVMKKLHEEGKTIIMITHYVEDALCADTIYLMKDGEILGKGTPREILTNSGLLKTVGLQPPLPVRMYEDLQHAGISLSACPLTDEELVEQLCQS